MKKIISLIITGALLVTSAGLTAFADYTASSYDIVDQNLTFDDGTGTGVDGTPAMVVGTDLNRLVVTSLDTTKEFFLSFDFNFTNESGYIETPMYKNSTTTTVNKVGLTLKYTNGQLTTDTGSSSKQQLGAMTVGDWYTFEVEGKTGQGTQYTTGRLYKYVDGAKTLVQETKNLSFRNISSENRTFNGIGVQNATVDNIKLIALKPDTITLTSLADEMNAGTNNAFDYTMTRQNVEYTKYSVSWSVYDEANENPVTDGVTISTSGILSANIDAPSQTVTVRATATFGDKTLVGTKQVKINAVQTDNEKFDTINITGPATVKAGKSATYSYTAAKDGVDVTNTLTSSDVVWAVYDASGIIKNANKFMTVSDGVLTVDESVIAQDITLKAMSKSGKISNGVPVSIAWADSQKENVLSYSACEEVITNTSLTPSWDGSNALLTSDNITYGFGDQSSYVLTEADIKFDGVEGHGLTLFNNNGSENSNIRVHGSNIAQQTGGSKWDTVIANADFDAWYHIEFVYLSGNTSGYNVYKYDDNGNKSLVKTMANCNRRNDKNYGKIVFTTGLKIDNLKISTVIADSISVTAPGNYMSAGATAQFEATASRCGLSLGSAYSDFTWSVLDSDGLPILDDTITISDSGLVTTSAIVKPQTITVRAKTSTGVESTANITIQSSDTFKINNIGINEDGTKIVKIYGEKNFYYNDDVVFIVAIKSAEGVLKGVCTVTTFGDRVALGDFELSTNYELPSDFDPETDVIETMVWTTLK
ncbi:MAG: hypothetical protein IJT23_07715 [Clostridia bacterium]|nr:hypothetical protein [Clostridia bacterium]